jgi:hypothetical protein
VTATSARARDTPGRATVPQQLDGVLVIDLIKIGARYECYRPGCPKPREEPIKPSAISAFIGGIKARHLSQYHGEHR